MNDSHLKSYASGNDHMPTAMYNTIHIEPIPFQIYSIYAKAIYILYDLLTHHSFLNSLSRTYHHGEFHVCGCIPMHSKPVLNSKTQ